MIPYLSAKGQWTDNRARCLSFRNGEAEPVCAKRRWICHVNQQQALGIDATVLRKVRRPFVRTEVAQHKACGRETSHRLEQKRIPGAWVGEGGLAPSSCSSTTNQLESTVDCMLYAGGGLCSHREVQQCTEALKMSYFQTEDPIKHELWCHEKTQHHVSTFMMDI